MEPRSTTAPAWPILFVFIGWVLGERWCALRPEPVLRIPMCGPDLSAFATRAVGPQAPTPAGIQTGSGLEGWDRIEASSRIPGPRFWRGAPGLGRVRAARVANRIWSSGVGLQARPGPEGEPMRAAIRAVLQSIEGIGPITAERVSEWLHGPPEAVHSEARGP